MAEQRYANGMNDLPTMLKLESNSPLAHSDNIVENNLERLRSILPEVFSEGKIDFEVLKQVLGGTVDEGEEKYGLNWHGKRRARQLALTPSTGTLRPCPEDSVEWDDTQHLMIEGDNLEVLKLLQKSYAGKVKLIYIDPPYNTGKDFVYPDDFRDNIRNYLELTEQADSGKKVTSNTETNGRFHTDWLNMMYPRIHLARTLLSEEGVAFVSVDDNEIDNLRRICDEVFGEENRLAIICHKSRASVSNDKIISSNHNFIVVYAKQLEIVFQQRSRFGLDPDLTGFDKHDDDGPFKYVPVDGPGGAAKGNPYYTFLGVTGHFRFSKTTMEQMHAAGRIEKVGNGLQQKHYLKDAKNSRRTDTTWWDDKYYTSTASSRLKELMDGNVFDNPKPVELVERIQALWARQPGDIVVDFFAGSGTTGHSVMARNAADGGSRRFILVQLPEPLDPGNKDQKAAADYCDKIERPRNIAELTKERLRRAATRIKADNPMFAGDLGFRVFKLDSSNVRIWAPDRANLEQTLLDNQLHLKTDRTESDILYELLLKFGLDLCVPIEKRTIAEKIVYSVGGGVLLACLAHTISATEVEPLAQGIVAWHKAVGPAGDTTCVFRDSAFADDVAKTNLTAILGQRGLVNVRSL